MDREGRKGDQWVVVVVARMITLIELIELWAALFPFSTFETGRRARSALCFPNVLPPLRDGRID
jgi:hypothetical protein